MIRNKFVSVLTTLALITGMTVLSATPAFAQPDDVTQLMPQDNNTDKDQLTDRFDGVDELARLTAVAGEDTSVVQWFFCEIDVVVEGDETTYDELFAGDCDDVGEDTEGVDPDNGEDTDDDGQDELAFEAFTDIGGGFNDEEADVVAIACETAPANGDDVDEDCSVDVQEDIYLDDSEDDTGSEEVPAGSIIGVCHADKVYDSTQYIDSEDCDEAAEFTPIEHGDVVSGDGFLILFRTDSDVTSNGGCCSTADEAAVGSCYEEDVDFDTEPSSCDAFDQAVTNIAETNDYNEWIAQLDGEDLDSNGDDCDTDCDTDFDLGIYGFAEDAPSECVASWSAGDSEVDNASDDVCVFEEIYLHAQQDVPTTIEGVFAESVPDPVTPGDVHEDNARAFERGEGEACEGGATTASDEVTAVETVLACVFSQFGTIATDHAVTFESEGVGGIVAASCEGASDNTDTDSEVEICSEDTVDMDADQFDDDADGPNGPTSTGEADVTGSASVDVASQESGTQTITICADDEAGTLESDGDTFLGDDAGETAQGCDADEPTVTVTKTWGGATAATIDLVFEEDAAQGCGNADEFRQNQIGDTDTMRVCTFDAFGNPASTDELGQDLEWDIENPNVVSFTDQAGNPPQDTGANGQGTATIRANAAGTTDITVCLEGGGATSSDCDSVTKTVSGDTPPPGARPECSDGVDNDGDGTVDTADADCTDANDTSENPSGQPLPLCNNGVDDDGDGRTDEQDPGCSGPNDNSESPDPQPPARSNTNTTIRYDESAGAFKGSVGSNRKACSRFRKVVLKKVVPGPNKTVGTDRSNRAGNWKVRKPRANGNFYAVAKRKRFTNRFGRLIICLRDKSPTINV